MSGPAGDLTRLPDLLHDAAQAGPVRTRRPVYVDLLPPCNAGCPAGENIQGWLATSQAGRPEQAWRQLSADNPLRRSTGGSATTPARACNRAELDSAVSIHASNDSSATWRSSGDGGSTPPPARSGKRVLVVGAGPSGLSAAYHLARLGHEVEIRDAGAGPGGMMRYGIPAYRLPRDVLDGEMARIEALGVRVTAAPGRGPGRRAGGRPVRRRLRRGRRPPSKRVEIPARDASRILDAVTFLRERGQAPGRWSAAG